jgi:Domain of unknown function (DUF6894)
VLARLGPAVFGEEGLTMQTFFFDMQDGVPLRDRTGIEFGTGIEAIAHSKVLAQHFRDESLSYDRDLEISVVNDLGREIHREAIHPFEGGK